MSDGVGRATARPRGDVRPSGRRFWSEEARPLGRKRWRFGLYLGAWTFVGLLFAVPIIAQSLAEQQQIRWSEVISNFLNWYIWGALFPLIWLFSRRFPFERRKLLSWIPINLAFGLIVSLIFVLLMVVKNRILYAIVTGTMLLPLLQELPEYLYGGFEFFLLPYFALVAFVHALSYYQKYRQRELTTSRLETQLAQAHLDVLKMQLRPHFLFNTLNAISALMHRDVDAADRMIALLSDLLRLSLDQDERHQVPLQDELEFLNRYLAIEKIRFRDRLQVDIDVESQCLAAQVPRLILQPLVENSIRHGIAMRSAAGKVAIHVRRKGNRLDLKVWDDGPGLPQNGVVAREGVGLANTRARLEQLYGGDHLFELHNAEVGGLEVHLEVPFEERSRLPVRGAA